MKRKGVGSSGVRVWAVASLMAAAATGCGDDGPTGPKPASLSDLFGSQLLRADGTGVGVGTLDNTALIGIYFASPTCPACGAFTPILVDAYDQIHGEGRSFEVVLVTHGISEAALVDYMNDAGMSWLAVPPQGNQPNLLAQRFNIRWVPTLVIVDASGNTVSLTGREEVTRNGAAAYDAWLAAAGSG
jgi:hypothetical protein